MKQELDLKLTGNFPKMYRDRYEDMRNTCMCWGFAVGDGWFSLLWKLSSDIQKELNKAPFALRNDFIVTQVKEKFGGLRFYHYGGNDVIQKLIEDAEGESYKTCEFCGKPGKVRSGGWIHTLCEVCNTKKETQRKKELDDLQVKAKRKEEGGK